MSNCTRPPRFLRIPRARPRGANSRLRATKASSHPTRSTRGAPTPNRMSSTRTRSRTLLKFSRRSFARRESMLISGSEATRIASVQSASVDEQIRWMLYHSDNTLADQYCHFAARQSGGEASFAGSVQTLEKTLSERGIPTDQLSLEDCSGLSSNDRFPMMAPMQLAVIWTILSPQSPKCDGPIR